MTFFKVDGSKCTSCGICIELCPVGIIEFKDDKVPEVGYNHAASCMKCGQCMIYCPTCANSLAFQSGDEVIRTSELPVPGTEAALNLIKTRRSVRRFKQEQVSEKDFQKLFDAVQMAPTASNSQRVRWVVTQNREKTKEVGNLILSWFREVISAQPSSHIGRAGARAIAMAEAGRDMILRGAPNVIVAVTPKSYDWSEDGVIALTYVEMAAHAMGLGCCWGGFFTRAMLEYQPLREYLGIGEEENICGAQMIGYPALRPTRQFPPRKKADITWIK